MNLSTNAWVYKLVGPERKFILVCAILLLNLKHYAPFTYLGIRTHYCPFLERIYIYIFIAQLKKQFSKNIIYGTVYIARKTPIENDFGPNVAIYPSSIKVYKLYDSPGKWAFLMHFRRHDNRSILMNDGNKMEVEKST